MAVEVRVVNGELPDTGSDDFTVDGFGTPDAAIVYCLIADPATGTKPNNDAGMSIGFWDGTSQASMGWSADEDSGMFYSYEQSDSHIIRIPRYLNWQGDGYHGTLTSTTNGVTITTNNFWNGTTHLAVTVILFKGLTNEYVGSMQLGSSPRNVTSPNFKPDLVFFVGEGGTGNSGVDGKNSRQNMSFGVAHNNSSDVVKQGCFAIHGGTASPHVAKEYISDSYVGQRILNTPALSANVSLGSFDSQGFTATMSSNNDSVVWPYLAIELDDPDDATVVFSDAATSTGNESNTSVGFKPQFVSSFSVTQTAYDSTLNDGTGLAIFNTDGITHSSMCFAGDSGESGSANVQTYYDTSALEIYTQDGTLDASATPVSFDTDGFTLNWTNQASSAWKNVFWAIKESTSAPTLSSPTVTNVTDVSATVGCTVTF